MRSPPLCDLQLSKYPYGPSFIDCLLYVGGYIRHWDPKINEIHSFPSRRILSIREIDAYKCPIHFMWCTATYYSKTTKKKRHVTQGTQRRKSGLITSAWGLGKVLFFKDDSGSSGGSFPGQKEEQEGAVLVKTFGYKVPEVEMKWEFNIWIPALSIQRLVAQSHERIYKSALLATKFYKY